MLDYVLFIVFYHILRIAFASIPPDTILHLLQIQLKVKRINNVSV